MNTIFDDILPSGPSGKILSSLILLLCIVLAVSLLKRYLPRYIKDRDVRYYARKYISFFGYTVGFLILASLFSDRLGRLTVIFGIAGAGVAFALQEVIASIAGWTAVAFSSFYKIGDRVQLGGIKGDVIDSGILRTTIMECGEWVKSDLYTGRIVRVANSFVFKEPVYNYSGDFPFLWDEIAIPIKHGSDSGLARKILQAIAEETVGAYAASAKESWGRMVSKYRIEDAKIDPAVTLVVTDNWLEFSVRYAVDYKNRRSTKDALFTGILEEFAKYPDKIAIASTTVHLVDAPTLDVRISEQ